MTDDSPSPDRRPNVLLVHCHDLGQYLGEAGYSTHLLGFQHEVPDDPGRLGYDTADTETKRALELVDVVGEFLDDRPVFASVGTEEPHRPFRREYVDDGYTPTRSNPSRISSTVPPSARTSPTCRR